MKLTKIKKIQKNIFKNTYDITVENNHNFFCNNHLIHNCDYRGEICLILINTSRKDFIIKEGERLAQGVLCEVKQANWIEVKNVEELGETVRSNGGFGHTGKK